MQQKDGVISWLIVAAAGLGSLSMNEWAALIGLLLALVRLPVEISKTYRHFFIKNIHKSTTAKASKDE